MGDRSRPRMAVAAAVLLALALVGGSGAVSAATPSAEDPVATVDGFLDTFVAQDVAGYGQFLCAEKRDAFVARFDRSGFLASLPAGVDGGALLAVLTMEVADRAVDLVENDGTAASVAFRGRFLMRVEDAAAREFIRQFLNEQGMVVTDEIIEQTLPELLTAIGGEAMSEAGQTFERVAKLIVEDGLWVICDDEFGFADTESPTAESPPPGSANPGARPVESAVPSAAG